MSSSASSAFGSTGAAIATAGVATGKTVAPATSCSWQQVTANGSCYTEPRSCYDCLNTQIANGGKCTLTPFGLCESISQYDYAQDYRRGGPAGGFPIHYNYFPQGNTTYCEASDALCNSCRDTEFALEDNNPSKYCTGANKCVCVKVCEASTWRNETLERLKRALSARNETVDAACPIAANTSLIFGSSGSSSANSSEVSPTIANTPVIKNAYAREDTCRWYQNQTFCDVPRSCHDCLNVALYSGERCMINPLGYCSSASKYDYTHDYRVRPSPSAAHYFPSNNASYCEPSDAMCAKCRETTFKESASGSVNPTQFCIGANDCVCVAFCESASWKALVKDATCSTSVVTITPERFSFATIALMMVGFTLMFTISVQLLTIWRNRRCARDHARREQARRESRQARSAFGNLQLQLDGWKSMCQELISKEQEFMGDGAILTHGEGPTVVIEEGDGPREAQARDAEARDADAAPESAGMANTSSSAGSDASQALTNDTVHATDAAVVKRSSCAWKEVERGEMCTLEPRTCRECLNDTPTNGDACTLTPTGLCKSMASHIAAQDFQRTVSTGIEANFFPSATASYCDASDAACTSCVKNASEITFLSDYCTGSDGCVCVEICETTQWGTLAQLQLPFAMSSQNESSACALALRSVTDTSGARTPAPAPTVKKHVFAVEDRCTWYTNQTRCGLPRTCYDCLNVPLENGERCTVTPAGYCASMSKYDPSLDFRSNASAAAPHYFPSANTTYCDASDAICSQCRASAQFRASRDGSVDATQFCVGAGGCVCVAFCESSVWKPIVADALCESDGDAGSTSTSSLSLAGPMQAIALIVVLAISVPSLFIVLLSCRARNQRRRAHERAEQIRCDACGPSLELPAWKALREELIESEHHAPEDHRRERRLSVPLRSSESMRRSSMMLMVRESLDAGDAEAQREGS